MPLFSSEDIQRIGGQDISVFPVGAIAGAYSWHQEELSALSGTGVRWDPAQSLTTGGMLVALKLLNRSRSLLHAMAVSIRSNNTLALCVTARAHMETTGGLAYLLKRLQAYERGTIPSERLQEVLARMEHGTRLFTDLKVEPLKGRAESAPIHVLDYIRSVDELFSQHPDPAFPVIESMADLSDDGQNRKPPHFEKRYSLLSDYCHPNWLGLMLDLRRLDDGTIQIKEKIALDQEEANFLLETITPSTVLAVEFYKMVRALLRPKPDTS